MVTELPDGLQQLACWQQGILTRSQVIGSGLTRDAIQARLARRSWQRLYPGIYATFSGQLPRSASLWAAVLRAGPEAMLSYSTAAEVSGLQDEQSQLIHVTVPVGRHVSRVPGLVVHRSRLASLERHPVLTPPQTRIEATVLDLAGSAIRLDDAYGWLTRALGRRLTSPARLRAALDQRARLRWRLDLAEALSADFEGLHSVLEVRYLRDVERPHALPRGIRQARARDAGHTEYRDVLYAEYDVAVELDGRSAHPDDTRWRDIHRDNAAAAAGILTLRYGWLDIRQRPCQVAAEVARALSSRGYHSSRPCLPGCLVPAA
ncbi:MAG TPA: hypothetical protein VGG35_17625 [Streptosporangiaceae bacterium]|jgi:hypothetical protein